MLLVMALAVMAVMAVWMRSRVDYDVVSFMLYGRQHQLYLVDDHIDWCASKKYGDGEGYNSWNTYPGCELTAGFFQLGFQYLEQAGFSPVSWTVPYWLLVLPLTLLSAYLILWKPNKRTV